MYQVNIRLVKGGCFCDRVRETCSKMLQSTDITVNGSLDRWPSSLPREKVGINKVEK